MEANLLSLKRRRNRDANAARAAANADVDDDDDEDEDDGDLFADAWRGTFFKSSKSVFLIIIIFLARWFLYLEREVIRWV